MKLSRYPAILFVILAFASCERIEFPAGDTNGTLLKQLSAGGEVFYEYTYNSADLIREEKSKFHYSKYSYNRKNQLIQADHYFDLRMASSNWYVLEDALNRTEWVSPENTERSTWSTYEYDLKGRLEKVVNRTNDNYSRYTYENGRIVKRTSYHENKASFYQKFYYDVSGNLVKTERYNLLANGDAELSTTTEYEFDNKHNPYLTFRKLMTPGQNTNTNNIIKETYTLYFEVDDFIQPIQVTEYEYEYNSDGFPVKRSDGFEYVYY